MIKAVPASPDGSRFAVIENATRMPAHGSRVAMVSSVENVRCQAHGNGNCVHGSQTENTVITFKHEIPKTRSTNMRNFPLMMAAATIALGLVPGVTSAQSSAQETRRSWLPMTTQGYVGANVGLSRFDSNCFGGSNCENDDVGFKIYTGGQFGRFLGAEVGFVDVGRAERGGGSLKARGANASLVGILPLGNVASVFGKVGAIYGFTRTTATAPVREGKDNGFGLSYGAGFGFDLSRSLQLVGEWDRYQFNSVNGDDEVQLVSIGMRYKF